MSGVTETGQSGQSKGRAPCSPHGVQLRRCWPSALLHCFQSLPMSGSLTGLGCFLSLASLSSSQGSMLCYRRSQRPRGGGDRFFLPPSGCQDLPENRPGWEHRAENAEQWASSAMPCAPSSQASFLGMLFSSSYRRGKCGSPGGLLPTIGQLCLK